MAFVASLLASFLCCTPIVPSLLAFIGISGMGLYTTTGTLQHFFAVHQSELLAASLVLLAAMCWWGRAARWPARSASRRTRALRKSEPEDPGPDKEPFDEQGVDASATAATDRCRPESGNGAAGSSLPAV